MKKIITVVILVVCFYPTTIQATSCEYPSYTYFDHIRFKFQTICPVQVPMTSNGSCYVVCPDSAPGNPAPMPNGF